MSAPMVHAKLMCGVLLDSGDILSGTRKAWRRADLDAARRPSSRRTQKSLGPFAKIWQKRDRRSTTCSPPARSKSKKEVLRRAICRRNYKKW
eukprot:COSAG02_NODE_9427_length_2219_cov_7.830889_2_plen_92_part_00